MVSSRNKSKREIEALASEIKKIRIKTSKGSEIIGEYDLSVTEKILE